MGLRSGLRWRHMRPSCSGQGRRGFVRHFKALVPVETYPIVTSFIVTSLDHSITSHLVPIVASKAIRDGLPCCRSIDSGSGYIGDFNFSSLTALSSLCAPAFRLPASVLPVPREGGSLIWLLLAAAR
jgi:hypothetical protein